MFKPALTLLPALMLSGCAAPEARAPEVGMANPASLYCEKSGGSITMREEADGTAGYCHLPDGRVVEEWALYRADHQ